MSRQEQLKQFQTLSQVAEQSLIENGDSSPEIAIMSGWMRAHRVANESLWQMLADHQRYEEHLKAKYEGGIFQYLRRAISDEWKKLIRK